MAVLPDAYEYVDPKWPSDGTLSHTVRTDTVFRPYECVRVDLEWFFDEIDDRNTDTSTVFRWHGFADVALNEIVGGNVYHIQNNGTVEIQYVCNHAAKVLTFV